MSDEEPRSALIEVRSATKVFAMGEVEVAALRGVDLRVGDGEFLVIVGPSGSGKSTLLNLLGGLDRPTQGSVVFQGHDLAKASDRELTLYRRREIGFVFQFFNLIPSLTALENVQVAVEVVADPLDPLEALTMVGLAERAGHFPSQLSGGEQQRVAIARALASNPRLLLCDEPTGALDSATGRQVLGLLWDLHARLKKTVVVITHNRAIAAIAPRVVELVDGRVTADRANASPAPPSEIVY
ncbi:MAG: ABC transporter ATP-binding protein [Planctomycetes bacterium]|nr:ABC transporter ATP-binding protein [Planctomycetota bacterium]